MAETEKNLARVFDEAERARCTPFFDEADALFGKRIAFADAHDRFAKQESRFLLQHVRDFDRVVMVAWKLHVKFDQALVRRFSVVIEFPLSRPPERLRIRKDALPRHAALGEGSTCAASRVGTPSPAGRP